MSALAQTTMPVALALVALISSGTPRSQDARAKDDYRIASTDGTTTFPFEWYRGHILLNVGVNGKELRLTLDNGVLWDALLLYGGPRVDALGLNYESTGQLGEEGDTHATATNTASGITIRLPGVEMENQTAVVTPSSSNFAKLFAGEDGVISGTLFKHFVVRMDFDKSTITLIEPDKFEYKGKGQAVGLRPFGRGAYTLPCTLQMEDGKSYAVNPVVDLGGLQPLLLFVSNRKDIPIPDNASPAQLAVTWSGFIGAVPRLQVGGYSLRNVRTGFTEAVGKLGKDCEGLLGPGFFERFTTTFDYGNERVFLEPNARFSDEFRLPAVRPKPSKKGG